MFYNVLLILAIWFFICIDCTIKNNNLLPEKWSLTRPLFSIYYSIFTQQNVQKETT